MYVHAKHRYIGFVRFRHDQKKRFVLHISNLHHAVTNQEVSDLLSTWGTPTDIQLVRDIRTGKFRGIAFVAYPYADQADLAFDKLVNHFFFSPSGNTN
eukprot:TRINITY_DN11437_c0_g1_i1.p1 TRINITY_DN11437_c0_g1~~TRINITY_DN11437_c0_g1_i1.p1  ORF type:complete len:115 (-),score=17.19 TRINITY_DN11437_c0_g1_i1:269-562(-)